MLLRCGTHTLDLATPLVMGILNVTPDSFADGGRYYARDQALDHAMAMIAAGAAIIDVGGESTRPGAVQVSQDEELARVIPVIEAIAARSGIPISIDTYKPAVMTAAVRAGACFINDVHALTAPDALAAVATTQAGICLMHMQGDPATMQSDPHYQNVVTEVRTFFEERLAKCLDAGIELNRIALDPGIGFGKKLEHNLALLAHLSKLRVHERPLLIGVSRKSSIGTLTGRPPSERLSGGLALTAAAILGGASIIRTHDVAQTVDAVRVASALRNAGFCT